MKNIFTLFAKSGMCPNRAECWGSGTATFMIGGNICTRNCKFCNVPTGKPLPLDPKEIEEIVDSIKQLNLKHIVITSVDRDDLADLGCRPLGTDDSQTETGMSRSYYGSVNS